MTTPEGIGSDVRLVVQAPAGAVLDVPLIEAAYIAKIHPAGTLLPFLYRPLLDPDNPDAPRPLRRAVLAIINDEPFPEKEGTAHVDTHG